MAWVDGYWWGHGYRFPKPITIEFIYSRCAPEPNTGCWIWLGAVSGKGYGSIIINGKSRRLHRVVNEMTKGPIPDGFDVDHICNQIACVNPDHLEAVTRKENIQRSYTRHKLYKPRKKLPSPRQASEFCKRGHPLTPDNVYHKQTKKQVRFECRQCVRILANEGRRRKKTMAHKD